MKPGSVFCSWHCAKRAFVCTCLSTFQNDRQEQQKLWTIGSQEETQAGVPGLYITVCFSPGRESWPPGLAACVRSLWAFVLTEAGWNPGSLQQKWCRQSNPQGHMGQELWKQSTETSKLNITSVPLLWCFTEYPWSILCVWYSWFYIFKTISFCTDSYLQT